MTDESMIAEKIALAKATIAEKIVLADIIKKDNKAKRDSENKRDRARRYFIGPFQFLAFSLIMSEGLLAFWMYQLVTSITNFDADTVPDSMYYERIVVGALSIAVLIAVLVVFSVVYKIKKDVGDCEH